MDTNVTSSTGDVSAVLFGACLLHGPVNQVIRGRKHNFRAARIALKGTIGSSYSIGEMVQKIGLLRGEIELPDEIRLLNGISPDFERLPSFHDFGGANVAIVEPNVAHELLFRGYSINQSELMRHVFNPMRAMLKAIGPEAARLADNWYNKGVSARDPEVQRDLAEKLIARFDDSLPHPDLTATVLREVKNEPIDVARELRRIIDLIGLPTGVMTFTFRYMPDGRPINWPEGFVPTIVATATELGLPVLEPYRLVEKHGAKAVLEPDMSHYRDEFLPVIGDAIAQLARTAIERQSKPRKIAEVPQAVVDAVSPVTSESVQTADPNAPPALRAALDRTSESAQTAGPNAGMADSIESVAERVNGVLSSVHLERVARLGIDGSGLFNHYNVRLERNEIVDGRVIALARHIDLRFQRFDAYHVLNAGLGEMAFVLAGMGLKTGAYCSNGPRYSAMEAGLAALTKLSPEAGKLVETGTDVVPCIAGPANVLCIAGSLIGIAADQQEKVLDGLSQYAAIILDPRVFMAPRRTPAEQEAVLDQLSARGFRQCRELTGGLVCCAKPGILLSPTGVLQDELPKIDSIVSALPFFSMNETGRHVIPTTVMPTTGPVVRDFPFPYKSAIAFTPGVQSVTSTYFRQLRDFLCGRKETPFGTGLGLEIGGSFTLSAAGGTIVPSFGGTAPADPAQSREDECLIRDLLSARWIDTLRGATVDADAQRWLERLADGGIPTIGIDLEGEPWAGQRFVSNSGLLEHDKFGDACDFRYPESFRDAAQLYDWQQWKAIFPTQLDTLVARFNRVLQPCRDGTAQPFKRFTYGGRASWSALPSTVSSDRLDRLARDRAVAIVDVETAIWALIGASAKKDKARGLAIDEALDFDALPFWGDVAQRWNDKDLLVATAGRLLDWLWLRQHLVVKTQQMPDKWIVTLSLSEDVPGRAPLLRGRGFAGVAVTVPEGAPEIILLAGSEAPLEVRREPDPAFKQRHAVFLPWTSLTWPQ